MNARTSTVMTDIYDAGNVNTERFLIKNFQEKCGKVRYLDEVTEVRKESNKTHSLFMTGGDDKKSDDSVQKIIYPSLNDMPDADIKEFLDVCHLDYITAKHNSNSIFIIPDSTAMNKIKAEIKTMLGTTDPKSADAAIKIIQSKLLYKLFVIDIYGSDSENAKFNYRLPNDYPETYDSSIVYRRTTRYDGQVFFMKLDKDGINVSVNSDMSNSVKCKYVASVGKADKKYISFAFRGNVIPLIEEKKSSLRNEKTTTASLFKRYMREEKDATIASEKFVAAMIKHFGVEKCKPYYSANLLHSAFAMIGAFGDKTDCTDCDDYGKYHNDMMKVYEPKIRRTINNNNINKITAFSEDFYDHIGEKNATNYFRSIRGGYSQIMPEVKDQGFFENEIAADSAFNIFEETNNVNLAIQTAKNIKQAFTNNCISNTKLRSIISYLSEQPLVGITARQFYPMISCSYEEPTIEEEIPTIKGGEPEPEDTLALEFTDDE